MQRIVFRTDDEQTALGGGSDSAAAVTTARYVTPVFPATRAEYEQARAGVETIVRRSDETLPGRVPAILFYYVVALLLGFYLRGRYDEFIYRTPHMQRRLRRWAARIVLPASASDVVFPLSTLDPPAFQPDPSVDVLVVPDSPGEVSAESVEPDGRPPAIQPR